MCKIEDLTWCLLTEKVRNKLQKNIATLFLVSILPGATSPTALANFLFYLSVNNGNFCPKLAIKLAAQRENSPTRKIMLGNVGWLCSLLSWYQDSRFTIFIEKLMNRKIDFFADN